MAELICKRVSVFGGALTRGKGYAELAQDGLKRQIQVQGDNGRIRWFPAYCFELGGRPVSTLAEYRLDDSIDPGEDLPIEVTVVLSNGERRWCVVATPSALARCGDWIPGTRIRFHHGNRHLLIAEKITSDLVGLMLREIDSQGDIEECTLPVASTGESA